jgi:hypothetical protein
MNKLAILMTSLIFLNGCGGKIVFIRKDTPVKVERGIVDHTTRLGTNDGTSIDY